MNLQEALLRVYEGTDEQDDVQPYNAAGQVDVSLPSTAKLLSYLRQALTVLSTWRTPNGRRIRFRANEGEGFWDSPDTGRELDAVQTDWILPTTQATAPTRYVTLPDRFAKVDNYYHGALLCLGGFIGPLSTPQDTILVVGSQGATLKLERVPVISAGLANAPFTLHQRRFGLSGLGLPGYIEMRSMARTRDMLEVTAEGGYDYGLSNLKTIADPSKYFVGDGYLHFNTVQFSRETFLIRYWRYPDLPTGLTDPMPLPEAFHEPLVLLARSAMFRRIGETAEAYDSYKAAEALINVTRNELELEREEIRGTFTGR